MFSTVEYVLLNRLTKKWRNEMLQIAVINESTSISDADVQKMVPAFTHQWNKDLQPIWGVEEAVFHFFSKTQAPDAGAWWIVFLDNSDQAGALAYHDLTNEGLPLSKVFVKTILADNASVSVGATQEICEMGVAPWLNAVRSKGLCDNGAVSCG